MKTCPRCTTDKPFDAFYKDKSRLDGLTPVCKECRNSYQLSYQRKNRDKIRSINNAWASRNLGNVNNRSNKRRAARLNATPGWADLDQIKRIYEECAELTEKTGVPHHVDHIIPLQGDNVCGLHVENNLRIIPATDNIVKGNTYNDWEDE